MAKETQHGVETIDANLPETTNDDSGPVAKAKSDCGCLQATLDSAGMITVKKVNDKCPHPVETFTVPQGAAMDIARVMMALKPS